LYRCFVYYGDFGLGDFIYSVCSFCIVYCFDIFTYFVTFNNLIC